MQDRRGQDRNLHGGTDRSVVAADGADQHAGRALALQAAVVVREVFRAEREVGLTQELGVLVAVRIEGAGDEGVAAHNLAHAAGDVGLGPRHAAHAHRAMQGEIDAVPSPTTLELGDHAAEKVLVGLPRDPARTGTGPGPERRFDPDQLDAGLLARHLHEAAHVRPRLPGEQRLASGRRTVMDEVVERGVVGQERHRAMRIASDVAGSIEIFDQQRPGFAGLAKP